MLDVATGDAATGVGGEIRRDPRRTRWRLDLHAIIESIVLIETIVAKRIDYASHEAEVVALERSREMEAGRVADDTAEKTGSCIIDALVGERRTLSVKRRAAGELAVGIVGPQRSSSRHRTRGTGAVPVGVVAEGGNLAVGADHPGHTPLPFDRTIPAFALHRIAIAIFIPSLRGQNRADDDASNRTAGDATDCGTAELWPIFVMKRRVTSAFFLGDVSFD